MVLAQALHMVQPGVSLSALGHFLELALRDAGNHDRSQVRLPLGHFYWIVYDQNQGFINRQQWHQVRSERRHVLNPAFDINYRF